MGNVTIAVMSIRARNICRNNIVHLATLTLVISAGCCGTSLWSPTRLPDPLSFQAALPLEVRVAADETKVILPLVIRNTSQGCLCFATNENNTWRYGLIPEYYVDTQDAPIVPNSASIELQGVASRTLKRGRAFGDNENLRMHIRLDPGEVHGSPTFISNDVQPLSFVFKPDPTVASGTEGTMVISIGLRRPDLDPRDPIPVVQLPLKIIVTEKAENTLYGDAYSRASQMMEMPHGQ